MSIKINKLEIENVKRVKAVSLEPSASGLTIIGGDNNQGKTSVLDAIAWSLGGNNFRPSQPKRAGSVTDPYLHIVMSNGLVVERKGKNSDLKVTDPSGQVAGQKLLDTFVEKLALNLPKFMEASDSEKAQTLLNIIGVGPQLADLEQNERSLYQERLTVGRIADQKKKFADEQTYYPDAPKDLISASDLIRQQQDILARNGENQRKREHLKEISAQRISATDEIVHLEEQIRQLTLQLAEKKEDLAKLEADEETAKKTVVTLHDESTAELEASIATVDETNRKVRANLDKDKAEEDAREYAKQYEDLTKQITEVRQKKTDLLEHADLPLPGLTVSEGKLLYMGQQWDNMSGSDQLKVATAIVRKLNPNCGFVLIDKLEQMDRKTLDKFGAWLESQNLQCIATRVSTGDECSIIISDGYGSQPKKEAVKPKAWKAGEF